jgi:hypothetical protein
MVANIRRVVTSPLRITPDWVVQEIERFQTELQICRLVEMEVLQSREILVTMPGPKTRAKAGRPRRDKICFVYCNCLRSYAAGHERLLLSLQIAPTAGRGNEIGRSACESS